LIPIWADYGTLIAQLTITPAVIYYIRNQNEKIEELQEKYDRLDRAENSTYVM
jgi:uncharacterized protein (DUF433 family)